jgi:Transglutaminase-like superfamily
MKVKTLRRTYLCEAIVTLFLARIAVRMIPASRIFAWVNQRPPRIRRFSNDEIGWVLWAINAAADKSRPKPLCLPRALATHSMLRRRGMTSRVCLGVTRQQNKFAAHAWVEVGNDRVIVDPGAHAFTRLAEFGGPS